MEDINNISKWIWLSLACGAGSSIPELLIAAFGDIESIYRADEEEYAELDMKLPCLDALCDKSLDRALYIIKWCEEKKVGVLTPDDPGYPARLYGIHAYPAVLYYFGRVPAIDQRLAVACVGTRKVTEYGRTNAYSITRDLAKAGAVIVSGLALGIDAICHRAALDVGGDTIAVLGCGLDRAYPPQNRNLMIEIARKGAILTEYAPFTEPLKANFPMRNRIISGLSNATVVYEADEGSGSLITARHAIKQGRPVYALPGNAGNISSLGTNELLTRGAFAVVNAGDILVNFKEYLDKPQRQAKKRFAAPAEIPADKPRPQKPPQPQASADPITSAEAEEIRKPDPVPLTKEKADKLISTLSVMEQTVFNALSRTKPQTVDQLASTGYPVNKVFAALTMLEVKKLVLSMPGGGFVRIQ